MYGMAKHRDAPGSEDAPRERPSKSARKREADELQALGVQLASLPSGELAALDLPENLQAALGELNRLESHGAQLRQRQYIGRLMREIDPEPLRERLAAKRRDHDREVRAFQQIERWRDRLLSGDTTALEELLARHSSVDRDRVERLLEESSRERAAGRAPAAARALFAYLKQSLA